MSDLNFDDLSGFWPQRFKFFHEYGQPSSSPQARAAFKAMPFWTRMRLNSNVLAFLFGPIYFFVKGMWRKGTTLLIAILVIGIVMLMLDVPDAVGRVTGMAFSIAAMLTANYAYYLHVVHHSRSWNLLEGFGTRSANA